MVDAAFTDDVARLARLSAVSTEEDTVLIEVLYRDRWVRFDVSTIQLQHARADVREAFEKALADVGAPQAVVADS